MSGQDFQEKESQKKTNYKEVGRSGTLITGDNIANEYLSELVGVQGQEMFEKMLRSDSQIRKLYHAVSNPIKSATWDIEPASDDPRDVEIAALIKQIIFCDLPRGFKSKLDEILTFPWHGHAVFEIVHKNRTSKKFGDYTGLSNLAFRDQRTLDKWIFTKEGLLEKIHQLQLGDVEVNIDMPIENLLIFYNEQKGNDNGYPFCRMLYGNYKRKLVYKQLQAIGIERSAIPVPHLTIPDSVDYDSPEYKDAVEQLAAFTQAEQAFFITPKGYELEYNQTATFDPSKVQSAIKAENEEISGSVVAMWLEMGIGGNSAVGASTGISADFFRDGIEYLADKIAEPFNLELIPNLVFLNFGEVDDLPQLVHNGIADEAGKELMEVATGYAKAGLITADEPLEDFLRKAHNFPKKAEGTLLQNEGETDETNNPDDTPPDNNTTPDDNGPAEEVELSDKKIKTPRDLIIEQAPKIEEAIRTAINSASSKYIVDTINRYKQLPDNKKQNATNKIKMSGANNLKKDLKRALTETATKSIAMARTEVPSKKDVELSNNERDMLRMTEKFGDISEIKLNDFSKLPGFMQVLIAKQADLITTDVMSDLKSTLDFSYSSAQLKTKDENVIKQAMIEDAEKQSSPGALGVKGSNVAATMVNEGRDAFFFQPEVLEDVHSFTFVNASPKAAICVELAGTTFSTTDAESLRYVPPLHHGCKSYLRANLLSSKGIEKLEVSTLAPSATAKKSITL